MTVEQEIDNSNAEQVSYKCFNFLVKYNNKLLIILFINKTNYRVLRPNMLHPLREHEIKSSGIKLNVLIFLHSKLKIDNLYS